MQTYKYDTVPSKGKEPAVDSIASSSQPLLFSRKGTVSRPQICENTFDRPLHTQPAFRTADNSGPSDQHRRQYNHTSSTWTSSNANINLLSEEDKVHDPAPFVAEYNQLARKYGVRCLVLGDFPMTTEKTTKSLPSRKSSWISRMLQHGHTVQPWQPTKDNFGQALRHRRSISDIALNFVHHQRKEGFRDENLHRLVRLCGKSVFYLPADYAPGALSLPTCLRATAQYLVQNANTSGIFRVPGSTRVVNGLYDYYCADLQGEDVATTTRCPNLPSHLNCGVHDVASTFKRILAGLPGGILGSLSLFDAFVAINSQFHRYAEASRTKESKLRARLIALAISTVRSQYQRELICAVFGLLCFIGRTAENAPREDGSGRPLPTSDLMSYGALSIIFGPLLVGDLLNSYSMKLADPALGLIILPVTPYKSGKHRRLKTNKQPKPTMLTIDRILVANDITEMIIMHWRDVVRQLRNLVTVKNQEFNDSVWRDENHSKQKESNRKLQLLVPDSTSVKDLADSKKTEPLARFCPRHSLPHNTSPTPSSRPGSSKTRGNVDGYQDQLSVKCQRPRSSSATPSQSISRGHSTTALSPTIEESPSDHYAQNHREAIQKPSFTFNYHESDQPHTAFTTTTSPLHIFSNNPLQTSQSEPAYEKEFQGLHAANATGLSNADQQHNELHWERKITGDKISQESFSSHGTTKRHTSSIVDSDADQKQCQGLSFTKNSTAGHTPLHLGGEWLQPSFTVPGLLTLSRNNDQSSDFLSNAEAHELSTRGNKYQMKSLMYANENVMLPLGIPRRTVVSECALLRSSGRDKSPGCYPFANDPVRTPPEYVPQYPPAEQVLDTSQDIKFPDQVSLTDEYSGQSPRNTISENSSLSSSAEHNLAGREAEEFINTPTRKPSAATRWKELVQNSPSSSQTDIKKKRKTRTTIHSSGHDIKQHTPRVARNTSPEWKRQLLNKCEKRRYILKLSPKKPQIKETSSGTSPTGAIGISVIESLPNTHVSSVSQRSTSKPISGTVRSIAARFDSVSQESTPIQVTMGYDRSHSNIRKSHKLLSHGAKTKSSAKPNEEMLASSTAKTTPKPAEENTYKSPTKPGTTPSRFRASISRLSHGLRPGVAWSNAGAAPSNSSKISLQPARGFISARDEPQSTPSKHSQRDPKPGRLFFMDSTITAREETPVAFHLNSTSYPSGASSRYCATSQVSENFSTQKEDDPRPGSSNSSQLDRIVGAPKKQVDLRNAEFQGHDTHINALYDTNVGTLSEQLRQTKRECQIWRQRAETAEERVAAFERVTDKLRGLRGGIENIANLDGWNPDPNLSSCSSRTEDKIMFKNRVRRSLMKSRVKGGDGSNRSKTDKELVSGFFGIDQKDKSQAHLSKASTREKPWVAAEEMLNAQETIDEVAE